MSDNDKIVWEIGKRPRSQSSKLKGKTKKTKVKSESLPSVSTKEQQKRCSD